MTPDTSVYMIAGFTVILGGMLLYTISILVRIANARHQSDILDSVLQDQVNEDRGAPQDSHENH